MGDQPRFTLIRTLNDGELRQRIFDIRDTVGDTPHLRELLREQARRNDARRCPDCSVHEENGHTFGCPTAERVARRRADRD